jgi:hypothetical protein
MRLKYGHVIVGLSILYRQAVLVPSIVCPDQLLAAATRMRSLKASSPRAADTSAQAALSEAQISKNHAGMGCLRSQ